MMGTLGTEAFAIPGTRDTLLYERAESGRLVRLSCNDRTYLRDREGERVFDDDLAVVSEILVPDGMLRRVRAEGQAWTEEYLWDSTGRPARIDGVEVHRDDQNRVTACLSPLGGWLYAYAGEDLAVIDGPEGARHMTHVSSRPVRRREVGGTALKPVYDIAYDETGHRHDVPALPGHWHRDGLGRLWTVTDPDGAVRTTYLWDGYACLGRIDGAPGEPLAAVFSLDPSCTPVRVITRDGVTRIPRDAFGEGLLAHTGVPGLFGGAVYDGFVHLPARTLDPRTGAFAAPDPLHGLEDDPRRAEGYCGPLIVENAAGPYAVCQNDPIGRADPTGEISVVLLLSTFTWSSQHNLAGWLVLDLLLNFWGSLFTGQIGRFFAGYRGLSSPRLGNFGIKRDGVFADHNPNPASQRAWTYQHIVWATNEHLEELTNARLFDPKGVFRPTLYGTLLRAVPRSRGDAFVLRGSGNEDTSGSGLVPTRALGWTRAGGRAEPVLPGSPVPHFPAGGLHFGASQTGVPGPQECDLTELEPDGTLPTGTFRNLSALEVRATGLGLQTNDLVLLTAGAQAFIEEVSTATESDGRTRVLLKVETPGLGPSGVRLRGLGPTASTENVSHDPATPPEHLNATGTTGAYTRGDPLRLSQGGSKVGAALVQRLEASLEIDAPLTGLSAPLRVRIAQRSGTPHQASITADAQVLEFPAGGPIPNVNDTIAVERGGQVVAVVVVASPADRQRRVDRSLSGLPGAGKVAWQPLDPGAELGRAGALATTPTLTYEANAVRQVNTAVTVGFVRLEDRDGKVAVRKIARLVYDSLVLNAPLPPNPANPYSVERFPIRAPDRDNLSISTVQALTLNPALGPDVVALELHQFRARTLPAGTTVVTGATLSGAVARVAPPIPARAPTPSQVVALSSASGPVPALVKRVRLSVTLDRALPPGASGLQVVPLRQGSPAYHALRRDVPAPPGGVPPSIATVLPRVTVAGATPATADVQMPRFGVGEIVEANWTGLATPRRYRVAAVEGTTLTLENDTPLPAPTSGGPDPTPDLRITSLVPDDPLTGGSRAGINGAPVTGVANRLTFDVWAPDALQAGQRVGISDGTTTFPAVVASVNELEVEFAAAPSGVGAAVDISIPGAATTAHAASFTRSASEILIPSAPLTPGPDLVVAIPFKPTSRTIRGELSAGTVLVPEDPENWEFTREQSLIEHELRHTQQTSQLGPLLLASYIPWSIFEGISELATDAELPRYSAYVPGSIVSEGANRFLIIPDFQGIDFAEGANIQLSQRGGVQNLSLGARGGGNRFRIDIGVDVRDGAVFVRRERSTAAEWLRWIHALGQILSVGGVMNSVVGTIAGGLVWLIAKGIHKLATGTTDWLDYFPATVPDEGRPASIRVGTANGSTLTLQPRDRVEVSAGGENERTNVTAVAGDGTVELEDRPRTEGSDRALRIAKVGENDPMGFADSYLINEMGFGWIRWGFDPYSQLNFRTRPQPGSFLDWMARISRYLFSSKSWVFFPLGYWFWDNALRQIDNTGHLSRMEQDASAQSGDLYSPLGRLRGTVAVVGDVARYWYFLQWRGDSVIMPARQDAPGVHLGPDPSRPDIRLIPYVGPSGGPATEPGGAAPNNGAQTPGVSGPGGAPPPTPPGGAVPDIFTRKNFSDPRDVLTGSDALSDPDRSFGPTNRGWVPTSPRLERTCGMYVAFTQPGYHRITVRNDIRGAAEGRAAHSQKKQKLFFDKDVVDVTATVAGQEVRQGATIQLVQTQRARVSVSPGGERRYAVTLTRPTSGDVLRTDGDLLIVAQTQNATEPVEISRVYRHDAPRGTFDSGGLMQHGLHLPMDVHIPIRNFNIEVINTIPVRSSISTAPASIATSRLPGQEAFVLVPAAILSPLRLASPTGASAPNLTIDVQTVPEVVRTFVGDGGIFKLTFPTNDPPEEPTDLVFRVDVGAPGRSATLETRVLRLAPHFRLVPRGGGTSFQVAQGAAITLTCTDGVNAGAVGVTPSTSVTTAAAGSDVTITVGAGAATGPRRILVDDAANPNRKARRTIDII